MLAGSVHSTTLLPSNEQIKENSNLGAPQNSPHGSPFLKNKIGQKKL
jgi:hypothetical protein